MSVWHPMNDIPYRSHVGDALPHVLVSALVVLALLLVGGLRAQAAQTGDTEPPLPRSETSPAEAPLGAELSAIADWQQVALSAQKVKWIAVSPADVNRIYAAAEGVGVYQSTSGGQSWSLMPTTGLTNLSVETLAVCPSGAVFAGTWGGSGVYRYTGSTWVSANSGLGQSYVAALACDAQAVLLAGTYDSGIYRSTNAGSSWSAENSGLSNRSMLALNATGAGGFYAGTQSGAFRSIDGGLSWSGAGLSGQYVYDFEVDSLAPQYVWAATNPGMTPRGVWASSDSGATWGQLGASLQAYTVARDTNLDLYTGTSGGGAYRYGGGQWVACGWYE